MYGWHKYGMKFDYIYIWNIPKIVENNYLIIKYFY
jgi:hypothetical protein